MVRQTDFRLCCSFTMDMPFFPLIYTGLDPTAIVFGKMYRFTIFGVVDENITSNFRIPWHS